VLLSVGQVVSGGPSAYCLGRTSGRVCVRGWFLCFSVGVVVVVWALVRSWFVFFLLVVGEC